MKRLNSSLWPGSIRRKQVEQFFSLPDLDPPRMIQSQCFHTGASNRRFAFDEVTTNLKMIGPRIGKRMKQRNPFTPKRYSSSHRLIRTAGRKGNHMLDMKSRSLKRLMHPAILAAFTGPFPNHEMNGARKAHSGSRFKRRYACARTKDSSSLISTQASSSFLSVGLSCPSLFRSINSCMRSSVEVGNLRVVTDSIQSCGTGIVVAI